MASTIMLDNFNGQRVLILMIGPADKFDGALPEARQILDRVKFGSPAKAAATQ